MCSSQRWLEDGGCLGWAVSSTSKFQGHSPDSAKTWARIWIHCSRFLSSKHRLGALKPTGRKVSKPGSPCVSPATSFYITNTPMSHVHVWAVAILPSRLHLQENQSFLHMHGHTCLSRVNICKCSGRFPQAFELWIIITHYCCVSKLVK